MGVHVQDMKCDKSIEVRIQLLSNLVSVEEEMLCAHLGGDLVLVKVGEVLELREDVLCCGKGLRLSPLPLLSLLPSCVEK